MFPTLEMWLYIGDTLWDPTAWSPLVAQAMCSMGAPYVGYMDLSVVARLTTVGTLVIVSGP